MSIVFMLGMLVAIPTTFMAVLWFVSRRAAKKPAAYDPGDGRVRWQ